MKKIVSVLVILLIIGSFGCKKKVTDVNKDFIGLWYSESKYKSNFSSAYKSIEIKENSAAEYNDAGEGSNVNFSGKARIKGSTLKIGIKKFTVDEAPKRLGNVGNFWRMKISGETYYIDKDYLFGGGSICYPTYLSVMNTGTSVIHGTMDGHSVTIPPNGSAQSDVNCFGCESVYSDDHGNNFSFFNIGCTYTKEIQ
ncbi:MAG: hypothetical protein V4677_00545 [Bacteroidota bacterium]